MFFLFIAEKAAIRIVNLRKTYGTVKVAKVAVRSLYLSFDEGKV